jgi:hypothetical protein
MHTNIVDDPSLFNAQIQQMYLPPFPPAILRIDTHENRSPVSGTSMNYEHKRLHENCIYKLTTKYAFSAEHCACYTVR